MNRRIVVTDHGFDELTHLREVAARYGATLDVHQIDDPRGIVTIVQGADVVMNRFAPITREALAGLAPSAVVVRYGIGYDNVDVAAARDLGVRVANVPDYGVDTVADHAVALILSAARRITVYDRCLRAGGPVGPASVGRVKALAASTLGLVGAGRIGLAVADRMAAFGCRILALDPFADRAALAGHRIGVVDRLEDLLAEADIVSLHAPLTEGTRAIINPATLRLMKPNALLVNTARGSLVDTEALADALRGGVIAGAALDVVEPEPLPPTSPLWSTEAVLTPHAGFYSESSVARLEQLAAEEAGRALAGMPLRCPV